MAKNERWAWGSLLLVVVLVASSWAGSEGGFQSDELILEDDEEWGIMGAPPSQLRSQQPENSNRFPAHSDTSASSAPPSSPPPPHSSSSAPDSRVQFDLEHAFGPSNFSHAGVFSARLRSLPHGSQTLTKLRLARNKFTAEEQRAFENLLKEDGFYKIRLPSNVLYPGQGSILSSVKARCLSAANLKERFDIYMDKGNVLGVGYGGASDCVYPRILKYPTHWSFSSYIVLKSGEQAMRIADVSDVPDFTSEDGETKKPPERSFWSKYWMYIVPLGLIVLNVITQVANMPDEQTANQGGAQVASQRVASTRRR